MGFTPEELPSDSTPFFQDAAGETWTPVYRHQCSFSTETFDTKMMYVIRNPNINSTWLFRADIIYDDQDPDVTPTSTLRPLEIRDMPCYRTMVRTLVPRNTRRDNPMDQTCTFHRADQEDGTIRSLITYIPHLDSPEQTPFYHPKVRGIAYVHDYDPSTSTGSISIHYLAFPAVPLTDNKLVRTAYHLLEILHKHGEGSSYVKRVHHDIIIPQAKFQNRYAALKGKYARTLVTGWVEQTDPTKHVFEDLGIACFLMHLWDEMYKDVKFPGFVDIGCGNGLLMYILNKEGYEGWGFDARERKSWEQYRMPNQSTSSGTSLEQRLLLPSLIPDDSEDAIEAGAVHDGVFPKGTFIVSNHADELTPWTPILAALSSSPFIAIPCCSHDLSGARYRAPPPKDKAKGSSTYASLVEWVTSIARDCGWVVETEMLRIPSTRNTCLLGRTRTEVDVDLREVLSKYGGVGGYRENVVKLLKGGPRGH